MSAPDKPRNSLGCIVVAVIGVALAFSLVGYLGVMVRFNPPRGEPPPNVPSRIPGSRLINRSLEQQREALRIRRQREHEEQYRARQTEALMKAVKEAEAKARATSGGPAPN